MDPRKKMTDKDSVDGRATEGPDKESRTPDEAGKNSLKKDRRRLLLIFLIVCGVILVLLEILEPVYTVDEVMNRMIRTLVTRTVGIAAFLPLLFSSGYDILGYTGRRPLHGILVALPALAVAVNNLPIIGLATGGVKILRGGIYLFVYVLESLSIGLFEEIAFRGVLYPAVLENRRSSTRQIFWSTVISSALFGGIHLFNLFLGGGIGGVLLQVGYSFLIGGMCSIVLLHTRSVWICAFIHALFDFGGSLTETLGEGRIWDPVTVVLTAVLGAAVLGIMLALLLKTRPDDVAGIFERAEEPESHSVDNE